MNAYQHVFFDLDRTLWDFETNSHQTLLELIEKYKLKELGITSTDEFMSVYYHINDHMWQEYSKEIISKEELRYGRFKKALQQYGIEDENTIKGIADDYVMLSPLKTNLFPHTVEVLDYLSSKYHLHIITNGFEEAQLLKIKNSGIESYFKEIITSERAGYKKPDAGIFKYSLKVANATTSTSLMIGDSIEADIVGARNASIDQVYFNPASQAHKENITYEIKNLKELMAFL